MLENFIENAIKYAPTDSIVDVVMRTSKNSVLVQIRDSGPGVPPELRQKVFERFQRVQPSNIIPGSGLGLSIAAEIARIHNVTVQLSDSEQQTGTVVSLTFPRPPEAPNAPPPA
jgi:signal transduction histidine kinase